jgi:GlpG protein
MRQIGNVANSRDATRLVDYLAAQGIRARGDAQPTDAGVAIWSYEEDQRERAATILAEFNLNPADPRYDEAAGKARALAREEAARDKQARRNVIDVRATWGTNDVRSRPTTIALGLICLVVAVLTGFGEDPKGQWWVDQLMITPVRYVPAVEMPPVIAKSELAKMRLNGDVVEINEGLGATLSSQPWRLVTPIFLHIGIQHFLFNMIALFVFGSQIEMRRGAWFLLLLTLAIAIASNLGQYLWTYDAAGNGRNFGGMSGVVYGLFGFIWMKSRLDPGSRLYLSQGSVFWMLGWLLLCMTGSMGPIANTAHVVGLVTGVVLGAAPTYWRAMLRDIRLRRFDRP